ncbi:MAG: signal peptidase II [Candidatus Pacebacteria bacterium]|nr:signal peptidase II [Candidatus Paceibacterota bacterium]
MRKKIFYFFLFLFLILFDQLTKYLSQKFTLVTINDGISFGLISGFGGEISVQLILLLVLFFVLQRTVMPAVLKVLFLAGVLSNTIDRLLFGGVRDCLPIPLFNLKNNFADWYIFIAIAIYVLKYGYEYRNNLRR